MFAGRLPLSPKGPPATRIPVIPTPITSSLISRRYIFGDAGDKKSGHISTTPQEGILYFNSILPPNLQWFFRFANSVGRTAPSRIAKMHKDGTYGFVNPASAFEKAAKEAKLEKATVVEVLPRFGEGGAFLKFSHDGISDKESITKAVAKSLKENNTFTPVRVGLVVGKPWVEDLARNPSRRLKVEFFPTEPGGAAAELTQEDLYSFFRPYGKLSDIIVQPSDSKVVPRYAYLDFSRKRKAIMAKNCLHGYTVPPEQGGGTAGTILRLTYEKKQRFGWIKDWIFGHSRIAIPVIAALIAGITVVIFDPIRTLSIKAHITRVFHIEDNIVFRWFRRQGEELINKVRYFGRYNLGSHGGMQVVWEDRQDEIKQIQSWLMESTDTFIVVQGPRGSGKRELVIERALEHKRRANRVLLIDCKPIQEARGDAATIASAASQVGYWPVFSWMNNISGLMDLAAQGMTGTKAGFSETLENQLVKIWAKTTSALKNIALESRKRDDKDAKLGDDEYLEAHPEHRPVVVIENFLHRNSDPGATLIYDKLAEWAAQLTLSNTAHVIFLTNDISFSKSLSKALPDRVFRQISLGDCSPSVAKRYVINHLDFDAPTSPSDTTTTPLTPSQKRTDLATLDAVLPQLGGRLRDLESFARRLKSGETPPAAVEEIISQAASEIQKMFLSPDDTPRPWTPQQAWTLVRALASDPELRYNEILLSAPFAASGGGEKAMQSLEQSELITLLSPQTGRPSAIKPGKPVYAAAFRHLLRDRVLAAKMDGKLLSDQVAAETAKVEAWERELVVLAELGAPKEVRGRVKWLLGKIEGAQRNIEAWEGKGGELKRVLMEEF